MRLRTHRLTNVVVAVLLAVLAAALTVAYASRAGAGKAAPAKSVSVLVATRDIPVGTAAAQIRTEIAPTEIAAADVVADAVTDRAQLTGMVATQPIYAGEQLSTRRLGAATQQGMRSGLRGTLRIVELAGDSHQLLSGILRDGDHVDVVASLRSPESGQNHFARVVLRNLLVVDTASSSGNALGGGSSGASVDLQLSDEQAQRLFWVERNADWTLALRPAVDAAATSAPPASAATVLDGGHGR